MNAALNDALNAAFAQELGGVVTGDDSFIPPP